MFIILPFYFNCVRMGPSAFSGLWCLAKTALEPFTHSTWTVTYLMIRIEHVGQFSRYLPVAYPSIIPRSWECLWLCTWNTGVSRLAITTSHNHQWRKVMPQDTTSWFPYCWRVKHLHTGVCCITQHRWPLFWRRCWSLFYTLRKCGKNWA